MLTAPPVESGRSTPQFSTHDMPYGRGGAGNIQAFSQTPTSTSASSASTSDLEAQPRTTQSSPPGIEPTDQPRKQAEYAHTGRGGAGNWYQPREAAQTGTYSSDESTTSSGPASSAASANRASEPMWSGRGGTGNFKPSEEQDAQRNAQHRQQAEEATKRAEQDVELGVGRPEKAFLGGKERTSDIREGVVV